MEKEQILIEDGNDRPILCKRCGALMIFKGLGTYACERCGFREYDDYGKVRQFLEDNPGASVVLISESTGVSQKKIRQMVKEARFQVAKGTTSFLKCEICGRSIPYGNLCQECEMNYHRSLEEKTRKRNVKMQGVKMGSKGEDGAKRFNRE